jgi:iron-sulfur cluster assembly protein
MKMLPVRFTESALQEIAGIIQRKNIPDHYGVRIGASGSGCSGVRFILGFDNEKPEDAVFEMDGFKVLVEKKQFLFLAGMKIEFIDSEAERGFVFEKDLPEL